MLILVQLFNKEYNMSDFKRFYEEQELLEVGDAQGALGKVSSGVGKAFKWTFSKLAKAITKPIKDMFAPAMDALKNKFDAILTLAEKYYPYDKAIYDQIKRDQNKLKMLDNYLSLYNDDKFSFPLGMKYSVGLDVIYRAYSTISAMTKKKIPNDKAKTSIRTLEQGAEYAKLRLPQMKDAKEVSDYFERNQQDPNSLLGRWIKASSMFSSWKNKYDNTDEETSTSTIVDQFINSNSSNIDLDNADNKMDELKEKGEEVNMANIDKAFGADLEQLVQAVHKNILEGKTVLGDIQGDIQFNEEEAAKVFKALPTMVSISRADQVCTDIYVVTKYIQTKQLNNIVMDQLLKQTYFYKLFQRVTTPEAKTAYMDVDKNQKDKAVVFRNKYLYLVSGTLKGQKMTKELADNIDQLMMVIYNSMNSK